MNPFLIFKAMAGVNPVDMGLLVRDWKAVIRLQFLKAAFEAGLLAALKKPRTGEELKDLLDARRSDVLAALLEVGLASGELKQARGRFRLAGRRSRLLAKEKGDGLAAIIQATNTYYNDIYNQAPTRLQGQPDGDYLAWIGDMVARAARMTEPFISHFIGRLVEGRQDLRILEIGCGSGGHLREAWLANERVLGLGIDLDPTVVDLARRNMNQWGLADRFEILEADIRRPGPELDGPYDLITLYNLVYYFEDDERLALFQSLTDRLAPGGAVAVASNFQGRGKDLGAANLNMATTSMTGCHPLPKVDFVAGQLKRTGLVKVKKTRLMPGSAFYGLVARI